LSVSKNWRIFRLIENLVRPIFFFIFSRENCPDLTYRKVIIVFYLFLHILIFFIPNTGMKVIWRRYFLFYWQTDNDDASFK
jgi:hypothetical protein